MAFWKRGKWYWADFTVNGTRYRVPLKDRGKRIPALSQDHPHYLETQEKAIRAEERAIQKAERGELTLAAVSSPVLDSAKQVNGTSRRTAPSLRRRAGARSASW